MANAQPAAARVWLSILKPQMQRIEARLIQWLAQGRLRRRKPPQPPNHHERIPGLKAGVRSAERRHREAVKELRRGEAERRAASAALQEQLEAGGKKGKEDPALRDALDACEAALVELRRAHDTAQEHLRSSEGALQRVHDDIAEHHARVKRESTAAAKYALLADAHLQRTRRHLPCQVPHLVERATQLVRERPEELLISMDLLRKLLLELGIAFDACSIRILFTELHQREHGGSQSTLGAPPYANPLPRVGDVRRAHSRPVSAPATLGLSAPSHRTAPRAPPHFNRQAREAFAAPPQPGDRLHRSATTQQWAMPREEGMRTIRPVSFATLRRGILAAEPLFR